MVMQAVLDGTLIRQPCSRCGTVKAVAHHEDYSKPLDVIWLCLSCHRRRHIELDRQNGIAAIMGLRTTLSVPSDVWQHIKAYRYEHRLMSNSEAIRELIRAGLDAKLAKPVKETRR